MKKQMKIQSKAQGDGGGSLWDFQTGAEQPGSGEEAQALQHPQTEAWPPVSTGACGDGNPWPQSSLHLPGLIPALGLEKEDICFHTQRNVLPNRNGRHARRRQHKGSDCEGQVWARERPLRRWARRTPTGGGTRAPGSSGRAVVRAHTSGGGQGRRAGRRGLAFTGRELRCCSLQRSRITALLLHVYCLLRV